MQRIKARLPLRLDSDIHSSHHCIFLCLFQLVLSLRRRQLRQRSGSGEKAPRVQLPGGLVPRKAIHSETPGDT